MKRWRNQAPLGSQVRIYTEQPKPPGPRDGDFVPMPYAWGSWGPGALPRVAPCQWLCCLQKQQLGWGQGGARGGMFVAGYPR